MVAAEAEAAVALSRRSVLREFSGVAFGNVANRFSWSLLRLRRPYRGRDGLVFGNAEECFFGNMVNRLSEM